VENSVIACPIDETEFCNPLHLVKLYLYPEMKFMRSTLGYENDKVMFSNQNVQNLLKFCQFNCDNFVRAIEYETLPKENIMKSNDNLTSTANKVKLIKASAFTKFFSSEKNSPAHEREDSIIFLSKNDLENLEQQKQLNNESHEKMKVFQSSSSATNSNGNNKKGWFKNLRNSSSTNTNTNPSSSSKTSSFINLNSNSMDRYQDMSKMIQERFGTIEINENPSTTLKSSSEISYDLNDRTNKAMQKCFSLQNIELNTSRADDIPDLVAKHKNKNYINNNNRNSLDHHLQHHHHHHSHEQSHNDDKIEKDLTYNAHHSSNDSALADSSNSRQQSFITEKLFNEFYVKTKQYSKSSSSLHQLLHFSVPQKMNIRETRKKLEKVDDFDNERQYDDKTFVIKKDESAKCALMQLQLPPPPTTEPIASSSDNDEHNGEYAHDDDASIITDDLPYCSVRDSIVHAHVIENPRENLTRVTPTESIYAEICNTATIPSSSNASESELSYKVEKPIQAVRNNNNISSIRISFGQDNVILTKNDSTITTAVKYN
jgi:hypothetical protein